MCLEVDHVTQMCTNMAGINSVTSRENDLYLSFKSQCLPQIEGFVPSYTGLSSGMRWG